MNPQRQFCPNERCLARGKVDQNNITIHSQKQRRYKCQLCGKTFSERKGTALFGIKKESELFVTVVTLLAYGCPIQAIVAALGLDERTIAAWQRRAGQQGQRVHEHIIESGQLELQHVQADEMRIRTQAGIYWMAMAIMVGAQLWLGGVVSARRDKHLIRALVARVRSCARPSPILLASDGLAAYPKAFLRAFRDPAHSGKVGRPKLIAWPDIVLVQVVKQYARGHVIGVEQRLLQGTFPLLARLLIESMGGILINTAFIERLNATFRQHLTCLHRRTRTLARRPETLTEVMFLFGAVYNFCRFHQSLRRPEHIERTPAMAAGLTDHRWSMLELLSFQVPPPPLLPPKRRGRPRKQILLAVTA